jgi:hypothetical protein
MTTHEPQARLPNRDEFSVPDTTLLVSAPSALLKMLIGVGDQLDLFSTLARLGATTSPEFASRTGLNETYLREWLRTMTMMGRVEFDARTGRYALPPDPSPSVATDA